MSDALPLTKAQFDAITTEPVLAARAVPGFLALPDQDRRDAIWNSLGGIATLTDWFIGGGLALVGEVRQIIVDTWYGPSVPDIPISDGFDDWWHDTFDEVLIWATGTGSGSGAGNP